RLTENPPQGENNAMKVFEYLYSRQHDFTNADWNILNNSEFIPIKNENIHIKPRDCFFKLKDEKLNDFFLCVDFGTKANEFLSKCGVKKQTSNDFAEIKVDPSHKLWKLYVEKYPVILENINPNLEKILNLAAPPTDLKLRTMALKYFIDNFDRKYVGVYNPGMVNIAFLPCSNSNAYARPLDCFINDE
ncbi:9204_t:CDS:2, partial [Rhizophagus irregularis]